MLFHNYILTTLYLEYYLHSLRIIMSPFARLIHPRLTPIILCCSIAVIIPINDVIFAYNMYNKKIVSDGRIITTVRDPPGQYSTYITPGDTRMELYRITTFQKFPSHVPINPCNLANNGFFTRDTKIE